MPEEPQREIEERLRAYAQKRREELGAAPEMPPLTRRLLQREAAQSLRRAPADSGLWVRLVTYLRPRTGFGYSVAAVVVVALFVVILSAPWKRWELALNKEVNENKARVIAFASTPVEFRELPPDDERRVPEQSAYSNLEVGISPNANAAQPAAPPPPAESAMVADADLAAPPPSVPLLTKRSLKEEYELPPASAALPNPSAPLPTNAAQAPFVVTGLNTPVTAPSASATNEAAAPFVLVGSGAPTGSSMQQFVQQLVITQNQQATMLANGRSVLESFRVEQTGDRVRIVDSDGSSYVGYIEKAGNGTQGQVVAVAIPAGSEKTDAVNDRADTKKAVAPQTGEAQSVPVYFFRVTGINRSLGVTVLFSGSVVPQVVSDASGNIRNVHGALSRQAPAEGSAAFSLDHALLRGQAVIGRTNSVDINAAPVAP